MESLEELLARWDEYADDALFQRLRDALPATLAFLHAAKEASLNLIEEDQAGLMNVLYERVEALERVLEGGERAEA